MKGTIVWGMGLAVCWTAGWLLAFVEAGIRRRLGAHGREMPFAEMMKRMHAASSGWCLVYVVVCLAHIELLISPVIGLVWVLVSGAF